MFTAIFRIFGNFELNGAGPFNKILSSRFRLASRDAFWSRGVPWRERGTTQPGMGDCLPGQADGVCFAI
jgi:hypothetical protein